ncbi:MAG: NAD(P)H-hydrate epimerase, partial [Alphaproteobacteria bacterium]
MSGELLTVEQMYAADTAAMDSGVSGEVLMEAAGQAIADEITSRWSSCPVAVLCGPGNNGGDGFVVARLLAAEGWTVRLALLGDTDGIKGDAALMAGRWNGAVEAMDPAVLDGAGLVVDGLFGAGLRRPVDGAARAVIEAVSIDCVAIDVPSGVHGDSGAVMGAAAPARLTVTFFRRKPG